MSKVRQFAFFALVIIFVLSMIFVPACKEEAVEEEAAESVEAVEEEAAESVEAVEEEAAPAEEEAVNLLWYNWGEEELPGWDNFSEEIAKLYMEAHPNVTIEVVPQPGNVLYEVFGTSVVAGEGPDIQLGWDGIWTTMWVWENGIAPISDYLDQEDMDKWTSKDEFTTDGKLWAVPIIKTAEIVVYNKEIFREANLDPDSPPKTWDELLNACEKIRDAGYIPISLGNIEGYIGVDWGHNFFDLNLDKTSDIMEPYADLSIDYNVPKYTEGWYKWRELVEIGGFNDDINSIQYYQGQEQFLNGESAMTSVNIGWFPKIFDAIGEENVDFFPYFPNSGDGELSTKLAEVNHSLWITPWCNNKEIAADFIRFLSAERESSNLMYEMTGAMPNNTEFDDSLIENALERKFYNIILENPKVLYSTTVPGYVQSEGMVKIASQIFNLDKDIEEVIKEYTDIIPQTKVVTPESYEGYVRWYEYLKEIGQ